MIAHSLPLEALRDRPLGELLESLWQKQETLNVRLPSGAEVTIQPRPQLLALPELEGYVPKGWKNAIYDQNE